MLKIHQPYTKKQKVRYTFTLASMGALLLGSLVVTNSSSGSSVVYATGDSRTIHDIITMQEMTQQICSNTDEGGTSTLGDSRDTNSYTVVKLEDGSCWMQQNLRLTGGKTLTSSDSDVTSNWDMPATLTSLSWRNFYHSNHYATESYYSSSTLNTSGVYYSFTAATAGAAVSSVTSGDVNTSICPQGWKLPTNAEYNNMLTAASIDNNAAGSTKIRGDKYKFPYASYILDGSLVSAGSDGRYWARTVISSDNAYSLAFGSNFIGTYSADRYSGYSIRCVAPGGLPKIEKPTWSENKNSNLTVTMPSVISIDATSGMDETANAAEIAEGTATATISSNTDYNITIHSTQPSLKDPKVTSAEISPVSSTNPVQPGHNAWGFWNGTGDSNNKSYTLPITTTPQNLYNSKETITNTDGNPATKHTYYVGISISPSLPSETYVTNVIITASVK